LAASPPPRPNSAIGDHGQRHVGLGAATTPAEDAFSAFRNRSAKLYTTKLDITKSQLYNHH